MRKLVSRDRTENHRDRHYWRGIKFSSLDLHVVRYRHPGNLVGYGQAWGFDVRPRFLSWSQLFYYSGTSNKALYKEYLNIYFMTWLSREKCNYIDKLPSICCLRLSRSQNSPFLWLRQQPPLWLLVQITQVFNTHKLLIRK